MAPDLHQLFLDRLRQQGVNSNEATTLLCGHSKVLESHRGIDTTAINSKLHRLGWNAVTLDYQSLQLALAWMEQKV